MKNRDYDVADLTEKIAKIHLEQAALQQQEQDLVRRLVVATQNDRITFEAQKRPSECLKGRCIRSGNYQTIAEIVKERSEEARKASAVHNGHQTRIRTHRRGIDFCPSVDKTDRDGNQLKVGDKVEFLTKGLYKSNTWTIYRLTETRVLCKRKGNQKTHRDYQNVRKL